MEKRIKDILEQELNQLNAYVERAEHRKESEDTNNLRIQATSPDNVFFSVREGSTTQYIQKENTVLIKELLQKKYDKYALRSAIKQKDTIERFINAYDFSSVENAYYKINKNCRMMIDDVILPHEEYAEKWQKKQYAGNSYPFKAEFITARGEKVRSKSELLIANTLREHGVPYRYEYPLKIGYQNCMYPDFTILKKETKEIVYWEHFGRMHDDTYRNSFYKRINTYASLGIVLGKGLIATFEDYENPLNLKTVESIVLHI